jgi:hypothetical protein
LALAAAAPETTDSVTTAQPFSVAKDHCSRWTTEMRLRGVVRQRLTSWLEGVLIGHAIVARTPFPSVEDTLKARDRLDDFCDSHPMIMMDKAVETVLGDTKDR